jgi:hypothetical protein
MLRQAHASPSILIVLLLLLGSTALVPPSFCKNTYDYAWLLKCSGTEAVEQANFKRFKMLVKHTAPETTVFMSSQTSLQREVFGNLLVPDDISIRDARYVLLTGEQPHFATERSLIWIDTRDDRSVVAVYASYWHGKLVSSLYIASNNYSSSGELPMAFWHDFLKWHYLGRGDAPVKNFYFITAKGNEVAEPLPMVSTTSSDAN